MVKGMNVVNLLFLVGLCWRGAFGKGAPPPPISLAYFPTDDGCYSYPVDIEYKSFTLNGKIFNRAVSPYKCIDEGTISDAVSFEDCVQQVIDEGYNSFHYDGNNAECSMHMFWVPKDNPLFSLDDPANEYYTKREISSGSEIGVIIINPPPNVRYQEEMVLYISEEMNTAYAANDQFNPVVKPSIKELSYNITGKYEIIDATVVLEGATCLADIYLVEDDEISGDYSLNYESSEVIHINRNLNDADAGCNTGDIYVFLDIIGDGDEVYPSVGIENVAEEQKEYIRGTATSPAIEPSLEWFSDGTNEKIIHAILQLSGDTSLVSKATVTYTGEDATEFTTFTSEMLATYTDDDGNCEFIPVEVELFDVYECPFHSETFLREDLLGAYDGMAGGTPFDACAVVGFLSDSDLDFDAANALCSEPNFTLPIVKTEVDLTIFNAEADGTAYMGYVFLGPLLPNFVWQDDLSDSALNNNVFDPPTFTPVSGEECTTADVVGETEKLVLTSSDCSGTFKALCWRGFEIRD